VNNSRCTLPLLSKRDMYTQSWLVIRHDKLRTYEVVGQVANTNAFSNKVIAMQRDGLPVSELILPVTNKLSHKAMIKVTGYKYEEGLHERLLKQHQAMILKQAEQWESDAL
jgi:hypothetical protein